MTWQHYTMALNIKNLEVERLATEVAALAHESKTEAIRRALLDRKEKLQAKGFDRGEALDKWIAKIRSIIPKEQLGKKIPQGEIDEILGYGPHGY